jgi:hypothetical protein
MALGGNPETKDEKNRLISTYGGAMLGVIVGGLGGALVFGHAINNPPVDALIGAALGGIIGFGAPSGVRLFSKAQ